MPRPPRISLGLQVFALAFGLCLGPVSARANESDPEERDRTGLWGAGLEGGVNKLVEGEWDYSTTDGLLGLAAHRGLNRHWSLTAALRFGSVQPGAAEPGDEVGSGGTATAPFATSLLQPAVSIRHHLIPEAVVTPLLGFGLGVTSWKVTDQMGRNPGLFPSGDTVQGYDIDGNEVDLAGTNLTLLFEFGVNMEVTESLDVTVGGRYAVLSGNDRDNIGLSALWGAEHVDANTAQVAGFVGLTWWFGSDDRDGDGIPDDRDRCPGEAEDIDGYDDLDGCPDPDNDEDGLLDDEDGCPTRPEDLDGYQDEDGCPDPDNDRDGIFDGRDRCPDEPEDFDGWEDEDGCPDPDNDQDGVPDTQDRCPRTPVGTNVDTDGCPSESSAAAGPGAGNGPSAGAGAAGLGTVAPGAGAVAPTAGEQGAAPGPVTTSPPDDLPESAAEVLAGVTFVPGSAELTPESLTRLMALATRLEANPELGLEIAGHTDATDDPEADRDLSRRQAETVRGSLIAMGVGANRLTAVGYGADKPVADNDTPEGRERNRRIEIRER